MNGRHNASLTLSLRKNERNRSQMKAGLLILLMLPVLLSGCLENPVGPLYTASESLPPYDQPVFQQYVDETREWVEKNRYFLTTARETELAVNTPFELRPSQADRPGRGILLVHGLGDSPGYFKDVAEVLVREGFLVRAMLLPGHGTRPADLMLPSVEDWKNAVAHQVALLSEEVDEVWLGGFSTGANLVTAYALQSEEVAGLLLFSPGFVPRQKRIALASVANLFIDWVDVDEPTNNYMRYEALSANAVDLYYKTTQDVRSLLRWKGFDKPALVVMSRDDSIIEPYGVLDLFEKRFSHPNSRFIWYGASPGTSDARVISRPTRLPEQRISSFSHLCVLFSPGHPYYGQNGTIIMLDNGQHLSVSGTARDQLWYSAYGYTEPDKFHARLTWNPYFDELASEIRTLVNED